MPMTAIDQARAFVIANHGRLRQVAQEAGVTYWWITKFSGGYIHEPGARKIQALLDLQQRWQADKDAA